MRSKIIWFTGLSGSGKTTLSNHISTILKKKFKILKVDGDTFRKKKKINSFTKKAIIQNNISIINYLNKKKHKYEVKKSTMKYSRFRHFTELEKIFK